MAKRTQQLCRVGIPFTHVGPTDSVEGVPGSGFHFRYNSRLNDDIFETAIASC